MKAISPLIASVLLISFTIAIGGVLFTFSATFSQTRLQSAAECSSSLFITDSNYDSITNMISFRLRNTAKSDLEGITASIIYSSASNLEKINLHTLSGNGQIPLPSSKLEKGQAGSVVVNITAQDGPSSESPIKIEILSSTCPTNPTIALLGAGTVGGGQETVTTTTTGGSTTTIGSTTTTTTTLPLQFKVFVTNNTYNGNLGRLLGADSKCSALAGAGGLPNSTGTWKAWLSNSTQNATGRLVHPSEPIYLINGTKIADDWTDLTDGSLDNPINVDQNGATVPSPSTFTVWTGTNSTGHLSPFAGTCVNWNGLFGNARHGVAGYTTLDWTDNNNLACGSLSGLFCFSQSAI